MADSITKTPVAFNGCYAYDKAARHNASHYGARLVVSWDRGAGLGHLHDKELVARVLETLPARRNEIVEPGGSGRVEFGRRFRQEESGSK